MVWGDVVGRSRPAVDLEGACDLGAGVDEATAAETIGADVATALGDAEGTGGSDALAIGAPLEAAVGCAEGPRDRCTTPAVTRLAATAVTPTTTTHLVERRGGDVASLTASRTVGPVPVNVCVASAPFAPEKKRGGGGGVTDAGRARTLSPSAFASASASSCVDEKRSARLRARARDAHASTAAGSDGSCEVGGAGLVVVTACTMLARLSPVNGGVPVNEV